MTKFTLVEVELGESLVCVEQPRRVNPWFAVLGVYVASALIFFGVERLGSDTFRLVVGAAVAYFSFIFFQLPVRSFVRPDANRGIIFAKSRLTLARRQRMDTHRSVRDVVSLQIDDGEESLLSPDPRVFVSTQWEASTRRGRKLTDNTFYAGQVAFDVVSNGRLLRILKVSSTRRHEAQRALSRILGEFVPEEVTEPTPRATLLDGIPMVFVGFIPAFARSSMYARGHSWVFIFLPALVFWFSLLDGLLSRVLVAREWRAALLIRYGAEWQGDAERLSLATVRSLIVVTVSAIVFEWMR